MLLSFFLVLYLLTENAEPSRADTTPGKMKATYSTNISAQIQY
jgi:hypothetical protein